MEKMAVVIGDEKINEKITALDWQRCLDRVLEQLHKNNLRMGIINGLEAAKSLLSKHFPKSPNDKNELENSLIIKE